MDSILPFLSPKKDAFYLIGQEKAEERFVWSLLSEADMTVERVAKLAGVTVEFVEQVR